MAGDPVANELRAGFKLRDRDSATSKGRNGSYRTHEMSPYFTFHRVVKRRSKVFSSAGRACIRAG